MKETYFLIESDYKHYLRFIANAWERKSPTLLNGIPNILRNKHHFNCVTKEVK